MRIFTLTFGIWLSCLFSLFAQNIPPSPGRYTAVSDLADMLTVEEENLLTQKLKPYFDSTSIQFCIVTVVNMGGLSEADFAQQLFQTWGIGQKGQDNGLLLLIAKTERRIRIQTGYGMEEYLPDSYCSYLINNYLTPKFKETKFWEGLDKTVDLVLDRLQGGEGKFEKLTASNSSKIGVLTGTQIILCALTLICIILIIVVEIRRIGKKLEGKKNYAQAFMVFFIINSVLNVNCTIITTLIISEASKQQIPLIPVGIGCSILFTYLFLYAFRKGIKTWLLGTEPKSTYTYSSSSSSYSDSRSSYSDYSDYSDSFGGGSSGGGGASGGW